MKFTGNDPGVRIAILLLLALFVAGGMGYCSRSEAAEGLSVGFGVATAGDEQCFDSMLLSQEFGKWLAYLATHGPSSECRDDEPIRANVGAGVIRMADLGRWSIGFGAGVLEHGDVVIGPVSIRDQPHPRVADRPQFAAAILVRRRIGKWLVVDVLHNSTGGSTHYNRGLNTVTLGVRF